MINLKRNKTIQILNELIQILAMLEDPEFIATQGAIARKLQTTTRTMRERMDFLGLIGAPIAHENGRWSNGFVLDEPFDFWEALKKAATRQEK